MKGILRYSHFYVNFKTRKRELSKGVLKVLTMSDGGHSTAVEVLPVFMCYA